MSFFHDHVIRVSTGTGTSNLSINSTKLPNVLLNISPVCLQLLDCPLVAICRTVVIELISHILPIILSLFVISIYRINRVAQPSTN
uniref:Uncharacterized protein n=1 Tax=Oryza glaberrima TaxID=4538 RepID=I1PT99_ORYGL